MKDISNEGRTVVEKVQASRMASRMERCGEHPNRISMIFRNHPRRLLSGVRSGSMRTLRVVTAKGRQGATRTRCFGNGQRALQQFDTRATGSIGPLAGVLPVSTMAVCQLWLDCATPLTMSAGMSEMR